MQDGQSLLEPFSVIDQLLAKEDFGSVVQYIADTDDHYPYKKWLVNWSKELSEKQAFLKRLSQLETYILNSLSK